MEGVARTALLTRLLVVDAARQALVAAFALDCKAREPTVGGDDVPAVNIVAATLAAAAATARRVAVAPIVCARVTVLNAIVVIKRDALKFEGARARGGDREVADILRL